MSPELAERQHDTVKAIPAHILEQAKVEIMDCLHLHGAYPKPKRGDGLMRARMTYAGFCDQLDQQLATHNEQLELQRDLEMALERAEQGKATRDDWQLIGWACGVRRSQQTGETA